METRPPTFGKVAIAVGFAISCFGLLLFLWLAFGGAVPLKPKSYRVTVPFDEATQLAVESDVRISGVSVGKVKSIELSDEGFADAEIQLDAKFAPIPSNTKSILRQKTLLGETYVELTPGDPEQGMLEEDGDLPRAQVSKAVQLDEIFRTFDEPTRAAFQSWMQEASVAFRGRGSDLNAALGNLTPFTDRADDLMRILDSQRLAVRGLIRDGGETFDALSERPGQLRSLILNTEEVFGTLAQRDADLIASFQALPTFLDESKLTLERLDTFAGDTNALITQLRPTARELSNTLEATADLSPDLIQFFEGLEKVNGRAKSGFSSLRKILDDQLPAPLARIDTFLDDVLPIVEALRTYRRETTALLGNAAAATQGFNLSLVGTQPTKYLRTTSPYSIEALATLPERFTGNRTNAYVKAGDYSKLGSGLDSFLTGHCTGGLSGITLTEGAPGDLPPGFFDAIQEFAYGGGTDSDGIPAPACDLQPTSPSIGGPPSESTNYPHVRAQP
ncbi:MAG TPA: MlaD family protein [Solirubrobacterales bacterium]|nr:MlaD family protein [Solirubrobacterales bacterium]